MDIQLPTWENLPETARAFVVLLPFALVFVLLWCGVCFFMSLFGWRSVAASYPDLHLPGATVMRFRSGLLGVRYRGSLRFEVSAQGLRVAVLPPFRCGHRPFFVPWSDVRVELQRPLLYEYWAFCFAARPRSPLLVDPALGEKLLAAGRAEQPRATVA
jgi:hypothetical protein